jgi:iron complex outermembrane receptor protein
MGEFMNKKVATARMVTSILVVTLAGAMSRAHSADTSASVAGAASDKDLEEIVVTGYRASLNLADLIKKDDPNVVDSIVAQDIGKLPDTTVGDALQRVTGVQVTRNNNQVVGVNVRGLPNVVTTLNGDEIFTTTQRTFNFQNLPAEVLSGLSVYKTSSADQIEGGIAGLIDVRTHRPFDFAGPEVAASLIGMRETIVNKTDPNASLLLSNRWTTDIGEFGALINGSYKKEDFDYPVVWEDTPHNPEPTSQTGLAQPVFVPFMGSVTQLGERKYPEVNASFQWKPNDSLEFYNDDIYTKYQSRSANVYFFTVTSDNHPLSNVTLVPGGCVTLTGGYGCQVQSATVGGPGSYPYTATSTQALDENEGDWHSDLGMKFHSGPWTVDSEFSGTVSNYHQVREIVDTSLNNEIVQLNSNVNGHGAWSLLGPSPNNAGNLYLQNLFESWTRNHGLETAWANKVKFEFSSGFLTALEGGVRFADRKATSEGNPGVGWCPPGPTPGSCNGGAISAVSAFGPGAFQQFKGGNGNPAYFQAFATNYLLDSVSAVRAYYGAAPGGPPLDPASSFSDDEFTSAFWAQGRFAFQAGRFPVDGQFGLRAVSDSRTLAGTNAASVPAITNTGTVPVVVNGVSVAPGGVIAPGYTAYTPYSIGTQSWDFLPSISSRIHWTSNLQSHLSIARTVTRPDFAALNPALSEIPPTVNRQGNGSEGNPNLSPTKVTAYDATLEYYFEHGGSVSAAGFYRTVTGYIEPETITVPYSTAYCVANGIPLGGGLAGQCNAIINTSASSGKGYIEGFELAMQKFLDFLPSPFDGIGYQVNYTWINSSAPIPGQNGQPTTTGQLTNVSKNNASVILLYEKYGFSTRLAATYRDKYIESYYPGNDTLPPIDVVKPTTYLDLGINYNITKQLMVTGAATNLLNAYYNSYSGTPLFPRDIRTADRTYQLGIHYRLR